MPVDAGCMLVDDPDELMSTDSVLMDFHETKSS